MISSWMVEVDADKASSFSAISVMKAVMVSSWSVANVLGMALGMALSMVLGRVLGSLPSFVPLLPRFGGMFHAFLFREIISGTFPILLGWHQAFSDAF